MHRDRNVDLYRNLIKRGAKIRPSMRIGVNPHPEWLKWLSYIPEFEKNKLEELKSKKVEDLEIEELEFLLKYKENKKMAKLFEIIINSKGTKEEELEVYDYKKSHSINDLMLSKLTKEELEYVKEKITEYINNFSKEEIREKVENEIKDEVYKDLSMVDSYILSSLARENYRTSLLELDKQIEIAHRQNDYMLTKSWENASKKY